MRVGVTSNTIFNTMTMGLRANNHSGKAMSPLEKQKLQLQEQIKKIEESKSSKESKKSSIEGLEKKIKEVEDQLAREKLMNPNKESETIKSKDKKVEQQKVTEESSQVINKDVMIGITSASSHEKFGKVAYSVHREAAARGDMVTAERALNYTTSEIKKSEEGRQLIERGIKEYNKQMELAKRANTENVTTDKEIRENRVTNDNDIIENDAVSKGEGTVTNEVQDSNTSKVVVNENSETKPSEKERLQ